MLSRAVIYFLLLLLGYLCLIFFKVCLGVGLNYFAVVRADEIKQEIGTDEKIIDAHTFIIKKEKVLTNEKLDSVSRFDLLRRIY